MILERESGLHLSRATLNGCMMRVGEMLTPIVTAMGQELLAGNYIQADETPVAVQMHDGRGKNHQAYLWRGQILEIILRDLWCAILRS